MDRNPGQGKRVLRYAAFHDGSDEAVKILEAARLQDLFIPVLETLLARQPEWATHEGPNLELAWQLAGEAGLDVARAKQDALRPGIIGVLNTDMADVERSEEHTSELQSLMRISYAVFCLKKKKQNTKQQLSKNNTT